MVEYIYKISAALVVVAFVIKAIIYTTLDIRNGHPLTYGKAWGLVDFSPYKKEVSSEDENLKAKCNVLHKISILLLAIFFIAYVIHFFVVR